MKKKRVLIIFIALALILSLSLILAACDDRPINFSIYFNVDGENVDVLSTSGNQVIAMPQDPVKEGYVFGGWFWDEGVWEKPFTANSLLDAPLSSNMTVYAKWNKKKFALTFATNGGNAVESVKTSEITAYPQTERAGYEIEGLYTSADLKPESKISLPYTLSADTTLYIKWDAVEYAIIYNVNGGTLAQGAVNSYTIESENITLPEASKNGYTFLGWYDKAGFNGEAATAISKGNTGDKTYYAKWSVNEYAITYNVDGGTLAQGAAASYTVESAEITLPDVTKAGYNFLGWYDNEDFNGNAVTAIAAGSTGDKTFYAKWSAVEFTVTYNTYGGTLPEGTETSFTIGDEVVLPVAVTKTGYAFGGWYDNANFTGSAVTKIPAGSISNKTYYAKWNVINFTITYEANNGTLAQGAINSYTIESNAIPLPGIIKNGYTFLGWYDNAGLTGNAVTAIANGSTGNKTFYAKWEIVEYTISYFTNNGTLAESAVNFYTIESENITLPNVTKNGYTFLGWYDNEDFNGNVVTAIANGSTGNKAFYAKWKINEFTITYNENGGVLAQGAVTSYSVESNVITLPNVTKNGYTFLGWYENANFAGNAVTAIAAGSMGNKTFYAKWEINEYTIDYVTNGGTLAPGAATNYTVESAVMLPNVTKDGYVFLGWYENASFTGSAVTTIAAGSTGNKKFYAYLDEPETKIITESLVENLLGFSTYNVGSIVGMTFASDFTDIGVSPFTGVETRQGLLGFIQAVKENAEGEILNSFYLAVFVNKASAATVYQDKAYLSYLSEKFGLNSNYASALKRNYILINNTEAGISEFFGYKTTEADYSAEFETLAGDKINEYIADASFKNVGVGFYNMLAGNIVGGASGKVLVFNVGGFAARGNRDKALYLYYSNNIELLASLDDDDIDMNQMTSESFMENRGNYAICEYRHQLGFDYTLSADKTYYALTGYFYDNDEAQNVIFPKTYNGKPVKKIERGFNKVPSFSSIVIPARITEIDANAFSGCENLEKIYCEASVKPDGWNLNWNKTGTGNGTYPTYWYSDNEPFVLGNFWHYVDGVPTAYSELEQFIRVIKTNNYTLNGIVMPSFALPSELNGKQFVMSMSHLHCLIDVAEANWREAIYCDKYVYAYNTVTGEQYRLTEDEGKIDAIKNYFIDGLMLQNYTLNGSVYTINPDVESSYDQARTYVYSIDFANLADVIVRLKNGGNVYDFRVTNIDATSVAVPDTLIEYTKSQMTEYPDKILSETTIDRLISNAMNERVYLTGLFTSVYRRVGYDFDTKYGLKGLVMSVKIIEDVVPGEYTNNGHYVVVAAFDTADNAALAFNDDAFLASIAKFLEIEGTISKYQEGNCVYIGNSQENIDAFCAASGAETLDAEARNFIHTTINEYAKYGRYEAASLEMLGNYRSLSPAPEKRLMFIAEKFDINEYEFDTVRVAELIYSESAETITNYDMNENLDEMTADSYVNKNTNYIAAELSPLPAQPTV